MSSSLYLLITSPAAGEKLSGPGPRLLTRHIYMNMPTIEVSSELILRTRVGVWGRVRLRRWHAER